MIFEERPGGVLCPEAWGLDVARGPRLVFAASFPITGPSVLSAPTVWAGVSICFGLSKDPNLCHLQPPPGLSFPSLIGCVADLELRPGPTTAFGMSLGKLFTFLFCKRGKILQLTKLSSG